MHQLEHERSTDVKQLSGHCALAFADARSLLAMLPGHAASGFGLDAKTLTVSQFVSAQQADRQASKQAAGERARRRGGQAGRLSLSGSLWVSPKNPPTENPGPIPQTLLPMSNPAVPARVLARREARNCKQPESETPKPEARNPNPEARSQKKLRGIRSPEASPRRTCRCSGGFLPKIESLQLQGLFGWLSILGSLFGSLS